MALFKAFPSRFILAIVTLNVSVSVAQMEDYPDFNESELFDLNSLLASSCDASQTCKGQIKCPACVKIDWIPREPYIQKNTGEMATFSPYNGILTFVLQVMMSICCGTSDPPCWQLTYSDEPIILNTTTPIEKRAEIFIPTVVGEVSIATQVALLPTSGVAFLVPKAKPGAQASSLLKAVLEVWPLVILTVMLCILSGIIIWALDCRANQKEFPRSFSSGIWEGFWWAFISMSTVGYGDRTPKSTQGRIFSVLWILTGIGIFSIFTASLATSLTTISLDSKKNLPGSKVAVLHSSIEEIVGMQHQAKVLRFDSVKDILTALDEGKVEGVLLDNYLYRYYRIFFPDNEFKVQEVIQHSSPEYGAVINNTKLAACFRQVRYINQSSLLMTVDAALEFMDESVNKPEIPDRKTAKKSGFLPDDAIFVLMYCATGFVLSIVLVGVSVEYLLCRRKVLKFPKDKHQNGSLSSRFIPRKKTRPITTESLEELEERVTIELHQMFDSWKNQIRDIEESEIITSV